jgi:CO/xanthine dehydrogenase Mo-binding subunit
VRERSSSSQRICWRRRSTISSSTRDAPSYAAYRRWARAAELASASIGIAGLSLPEAISPGLEETHYFAPAQATYCNGTHVAEVEVDIATCHVRILNYVVAHDAGRLINPLIVDGQIQAALRMASATRCSKR